MTTPKDEITLDRAIEIHKASKEHTWWSLVGDCEYDNDDLGDFIYQIFDRGWEEPVDGVECNPLPDTIKLVVGKRLTLDVREALIERYDIDDYEPTFDEELLVAAQKAVDAAAASSDTWAYDYAYLVDIRPEHGQMIADWKKEMAYCENLVNPRRVDLMKWLTQTATDMGVEDPEAWARAQEITCDDCQVRHTCTWAWDAYNTNGDCIASK